MQLRLYPATSAAKMAAKCRPGRVCSKVGSYARQAKAYAFREPLASLQSVQSERARYGRIVGS
jgi:hypothetical protein